MVKVVLNRRLLYQSVGLHWLLYGWLPVVAVQSVQRSAVTHTGLRGSFVFACKCFSPPAPAGGAIRKALCPHHLGWGRTDRLWHSALGLGFILSFHCHPFTHSVAVTSLIHSVPVPSIIYSVPVPSHFFHKINRMTLLFYYFLGYFFRFSKQ